jgi:hypothetical protein
MPSAVVRIADFECPDCGFESAFSGRCPNCECPLYDQRHARPWQFAAKQSSPGSLDTPWKWMLQYAALSIGLSWLLSAGLCVGSFALLVGWLLLWIVAGTDRWREYSLKKRYATTHRQPLADARDGQRVTVSGMPIVQERALAPEGIDALAYELHYSRKIVDDSDATLIFLSTSEPKKPFVCRTGGACSMQVDGIEVRVKLEHFLLLAPVVERARMIPEGTPVRISGLARWVRDESRMGLRSDGRVLELYGTKDEPILIEPIPLEQWLDHASTDATHTSVRVEANATAPVTASDVHAVPREPERAEDEPATRAR